MEPAVELTPFQEQIIKIMHRSQFRLLPDNWKYWYKQYVPSSPSIRFIKALWNFVEISCLFSEVLENLNFIAFKICRNYPVLSRKSFVRHPFHSAEPPSESVALRSGMRLLNKKHYSGSALGYGSCWCALGHGSCWCISSGHPDRLQGKV